MTVDKAILKATRALIGGDGVRVATVFISPRLTVRATMRRFKGRLSRDVRRDKGVDITLTIGRPNCEAREFITQARRAGEPFPIKKVRLQFVAR
jgi:hypothetical protein